MSFKPALLASAAALTAAACTSAQSYPYASRQVHVIRAEPGAYYAYAPLPPAPPLPPRPPRPFSAPHALAPPAPPLPPRPPLAFRGKSLEEAIAEARARGDQVTERNVNGRRTVIITGKGTNMHLEFDDSPEGRERARAAREAGRLAREAGQRAREAGRLAREHGLRAGEEARRAGEAARRAGEEARRQGERARAFAFVDPHNSTHVTVLRREEIDRITRDARRAGEDARRQVEALRPQIEEIRRNAQRLREQCERGEIKCEIIITEPGRP